MLKLAVMRRGAHLARPFSSTAHATLGYSSNPTVKLK